MAGYLLAGALKGASGEYLKQRDEDRAAKFQEIRDKRLDEIRRGQIGYEQELRTTENIRQEGVTAQAAKEEREFKKSEREAEEKAAETAAQKAHERKMQEPFSTARGSETGRMVKQPDGTYKYEMVTEREYEHAPTAASQSKLEWDQSTVTIRGTNKKEKLSDLRESWRKQAYGDRRDDLGNVIETNVRLDNVPDFPIWLNQQVIDEDQIDSNDPKYMTADPDKMWNYGQQQDQFRLPGGRDQLLNSIKSLHPWWNPPGTGTQDDPTVPSPDPNVPSPSAGPGEGGYLETATPPAPTQQQPALQAGASTSQTPEQQAGMLTQGQTQPQRQGVPEIEQQLQDLDTQLARVREAISASRDRGESIGQRQDYRTTFMQLQNRRKLLERELEIQRQLAASRQFEAALPQQGGAFPTM